LEPLIHFAIPFFLMVIFGVGKKRAAFASIFAMLPDLDYFFGVHRSATHSLVVLAAVSLLSLVLALKKARDKFGLAAICSIALLSHPFLDLFNDFTPILWPLFGGSVFLKIEALMLQGPSSLSLNLNAGLLTSPFPFSNAIGGESILSGEGLIIAMVLMAGALLKDRVPKGEEKKFKTSEGLWEEFAGDLKG